MTDLVAQTDQLELFVADIVDAAPKSDIQSMEYPLFAISSRPDANKFRYENERTGEWIEIIPSVDGRATIHDKDLLLYCFGQIAEANNRGKPTSRKVHMVAYDYLTTTKRGTDGKSYKAIGDTLARLRGTTFKTNILAKDKLSKKSEVFGLIDYGKAVTDDKGRLQHVEVVISEQLFKAVTNNNILTYNMKYFDLRSPYDRRLYEIARKHCGNQGKWEIGLELLWKKFGVRSPLREFRRKIKNIVKAQTVPDYFIEHQTKKESGTIEKLIIHKDKDGELKRDWELILEHTE